MYNNKFAMTQMKTVSTCVATCADCGRGTPYPFLGDFAYGTFILSRLDGKAYRHLDAIGNPAFEEISRVLGGRASTSVLQDVVARSADSEGTAPFTMDMVCPLCGSHHFESWGGECVGTVQIPEASFNVLMGLPPTQRAELIQRRQQEIKGEQSGEPEPPNTPEFKS